MSVHERTAHAVLWSTVEIAARFGAQFAVTLVLARLLLPSDFGLVAMLLVFTSIGVLLTNAGFGAALIQRRETTDDDETTVFCFNIATATIVAALLWTCAGSIARFYSQPELAALTRVAAFAIPIGALGAVPDALLTKRLAFRSRTNAQLIASIGSGSLAILLALRGHGAWSLVWQTLSANSLRSVCLWFFSAWRPRGTFRLSSFRVLFGFGGYLLMSGLLNEIAGRVQSLIIGRLFDARSVGFYALAGSVPGSPKSFIGALLGRVGLPVFATMADRPDKLREALRISLRLSMFLFIPCMFGIAVVARPLIVTLYGEKWGPAAPLTALLAIAAVLFPLHVLNLSVLAAQGRSDRFFNLEIFKHVTIILLTLLAAPFGTTAIAASTIVAGVCAAAINTWYTRKTLGFGLASQLLDQKGTFALTLLASVPAWCVLHWTKPGIVPTLAAIALAVFIYFGAAFALRHPALTDLLSVLRKLLKPRQPQPAERNV
jgi:O-antigen/teichoic acid export membrane protein